MRREAGAYATVEIRCCLWGKAKTMMRNADVLNSVHSSERWIIGSIAIEICILYRRNLARRRRVDEFIWMNLNLKVVYVGILRDFVTHSRTRSKRRENQSVLKIRSIII